LKWRGGAATEGIGSGGAVLVRLLFQMRRRHQIQPLSPSACNWQRDTLSAAENSVRTSQKPKKTKNKHEIINNRTHVTSLQTQKCHQQNEILAWQHNNGFLYLLANTIHFGPWSTIYINISYKKVSSSSTSSEHFSARRQLL